MNMNKIQQGMQTNRPNLHTIVLQLWFECVGPSHAYGACTYTLTGDTNSCLLLLHNVRSSPLQQTYQI